MVLYLHQKNFRIENVTCIVVLISVGSHVVSEAKRTSISLEACPGKGRNTRPASSRVFCSDGSPFNAKSVKLQK